MGSEFFFECTSCASYNPFRNRDLVPLQAVQAAGLASAIDDRGPYTVLAPTNAAFARLPASQLTALLANKSALTTVLQRHVIADRILVNKPTVEDRNQLKRATNFPVFSAH
jgi:uncharacterized surface protein with fasciclin (FAS1) repeats